MCAASVLRQVTLFQRHTTVLSGGWGKKRVIEKPILACDALCEQMQEKVRGKLFFKINNLCLKDTKQYESSVLLSKDVISAPMKANRKLPSFGVFLIFLLCAFFPFFLFFIGEGSKAKELQNQKVFTHLS